MADYKEHGNRYYELKSIKGPDGHLHYHYEVGTIVEVEGVREHRPSADFSAKLVEDAEAWIKLGR
ncbi:hypothetical protein GFL54_18990 [Rhizobium laguerreae]|uniref:hypothetical protein n=1 Tax=Rhizobium laguerreae TaxID=1076926 RepID=UPI00143F9D22|nr:hypothetical protein [Rhizobium laguerreae]NKM86349.1 hypothetical protein [Rhizobium laguerreae]